ncbi:hypothetical protein TI03_02580 [Achromatium sp. WMS1]|nr:hypothetical protein TI03_02580 [Achromatium sp. WMS1]
MSKPLALIVDDEPDIRELLEITLNRMNIDTIAASDLGSAKQYLQSNKPFNLCLTDLRLPDGNGLDLVEEIGDTMPHLPIAVITAHGSMETAIQALKAGAFDFITKPINLETLRQLTKTALKLSTTNSKSHTNSSSHDETIELLGISPAMQNLRTLINKVARTQAPVHITGESGTGKELVARLIHTQGPRCEQPFIAINCGAIPAELMESEFFGHKKGSFTGAIADKKGLFQAAEGGTLFLDEVADLPLHMQVKLLRAIQEKSVRAIGSQQELAVNVNLISATHKNLAQLVDKGQFRQDLYYRIHVIEIAIPPLRDRPEDIPILASHLLQRFANQNQPIQPLTLTIEAQTALCQYSFPGNVRELANILERAVALGEAGRINAKDLKLPANQEIKQCKTVTSLSKQPITNSDAGLNASLEQVERQIIAHALETNHWNRTAAAKKLGISPRALRYRLEKLGFDPDAKLPAT